MPGVTLTFVLADGPGEGLRSPVSTVTPSSSMVDFFNGASPPLLPQAQFRLREDMRLEDLVTEHELGDSSEVVARRVAGYLDLVASIALPLAYLLFILIYLLEFDSASTIQRSIFRNALSRSIPRAASARQTKATSMGRSSSTNRRSASRRRSAASGAVRLKDSGVVTAMTIAVLPQWQYDAVALRRA